MKVDAGTQSTGAPSKTLKTYSQSSLYLFISFGRIIAVSITSITVSVCSLTAATVPHTEKI